MKKRILITGGAGFIGSHLCDRLLVDGWAVTCVDNFFTGSRENIAHLNDNSDFELLEHDVCVPLDVQVDAIVNCASPASPVHYQKDPVETVRANVIGTANLLELAKKLKVPFLQASTSEVYGDPLMHPQKEEYWGNVNPIGPRACYDEGKRCAETLCMDYHREYGVDVKIVRIFNTYGPRMARNDGRVVSNFIVNALEGKDLVIYGDGHTTRSFQYVSDLVEGMVKMLAADGFVGPVNIGNPYEFSIKMLAEKVIELTETSSEIVYLEGREDDPRRRCPDISLAKETLNWKPAVELEKGLQETINYFQQ